MPITSGYNSAIPSLKREHFKCDVADDDHRLCIPTLTKSKVYSDGQSFYFAWSAKYGRKETYYLQATGNIAKGDQWKNNGPKWWGFECRCSCPEFAEQEKKTIASNYMEHHVCHHLQIALELCVDLKASNGMPSPTSVITPTPSLPAAPSIDEEEFRTRRAVSPVRETNSVDRVIIPRLSRFHFIDDSTRYICRRVPTVTKAIVDPNGGEFDVQWQATGGKDDDNEYKYYQLRASGNIKQLEKLNGPQWWGFSVSCNCPDFLRQRLRCETESGWTQNYVCPHLGRALEQATDSERMKYCDHANDSEGESSIDAILAVECSDRSVGENSLQALLTVDGSDGTSASENSIAVQLTSIDNASVDECSISALVSVQ